MDRYQASVLNRITEKGGPVWTILALIVMRGVPTGLAVFTAGKTLGWL